MLNRIAQIICLLTLLLTASGFAQPRMYVNGHLSLQPGQSVKSRYYSPGITTALGDTLETTMGIGSGMSLGWMFKSWLGVYLNGDWVFQSESYHRTDSRAANTFDFDLGARANLLSFGTTSPYLQLNYGYSNLAVKVGVPTIYIGQGSSGYSSGVNEWEGSHLGLALGLEFGETAIAQEVQGKWDVHLVVARSAYADSPTITTFRLNIGYTWWFLF